MIKRSEKLKIPGYLERKTFGKIQNTWLPGAEKLKKRKDLMIPPHLFIYAFILSIYDSFTRKSVKADKFTGACSL